MRGMFVGINILGEILLAFTSKHGGTGSKAGMEDTVYAITADAIMRQPEEKREALTRDLAQNFLAKPDVIGGDAEQAETILRARVTNLERNPWIARATPQIAPEASQKPDAPEQSWKKKVTAQPSCGVAAAL